ncbi:zwei Ig domain protein zig-8-like isoform X2 [Mytilus galloprovincialis]|uniref:zwei Ig domain protein zig-8-like isoform X2 n=1 Tax=Mytilus galloprovincialis TaxID=29158 RepID=UPI003F7CA913
MIIPWIIQVLGRNGPVLPPKFLPVPRHITVHRGETAMLECTVENLGTKKVTWRKIPYITPITTGEQLFAQDNRFQAKHISWKQQWNLSIKNVQLHDAGAYECQVSVRGLMLRQNITLSVIDAILPRKAEIRISGTEFPEKGSSIKLFCNATGTPNPPDDIQWFKDGEKLFSDPYEKIYIKKHYARNAGVLTSSLEIKSSKLDDNGTYICRATSHSQDDLITKMKVNVLSAGSNYAKRGTLNHTSRPESVDPRDAARFLSSTAGLICTVLFLQVVLHVGVLS